MPFRAFILMVAFVTLGAAPPYQGPRPDPFPGLVGRCIGPAVMGGRITSLAVVEKDPATQYVGAAAGGLWKTTDDGKTWACVFAGQPNASIGAVAVAPSDSSVVWVGTGEANARNSVSWGNGVFVSRNAGKTWVHVGLVETHHIGRILVHPTDPNTAYVAALGRLWGANPERGVFVTRDGGKTWQHCLKLDSDTGAVDLVMDSNDPQLIYAAAYAVRRDDFSGGNPQQQFSPRAGIYRSRDGGTSWGRLMKGLPKRPMGRIGLEVYRKDPRVVFAVIQTDRTDISKVTGQPARQGGPVETGGIFVSRDEGETWRKLNDLCPRPFYFSQIRVDPTNEARLWALGIPLYVSVDGGRIFTISQGAKSVHVDHHDLWIDPADPRHLILAGDGGLYYSRSRGQNWTAINNLPISQFYGIALDMGTPYRIYGGLQDNGSWGGPSRTSDPRGIFNADWTKILGFDGYHCAAPPDDPNTIYAEGQYGRLFRIERRPSRFVPIAPKPMRSDEPKYRFNWSSPIVLSSHDTKTLYYGGNHLFKSADRGQSWRRISDDLTRGKPGVLYDHLGHTLTAIAESPVRAGLLYAGSDDGKIHTSDDDGKTWVDVSDNLPSGRGMSTITRIACSFRRERTVVLALTRHRQDDRTPYLFRSDDQGKSWRSLRGDLPGGGVIHALCLSPRNPRLLFVGTETGLFASLDAGTSWQRMHGIPPCPVHDLVIHPREHELVVATHGRAIYVLDVAPLEELTRRVEAAPAHLFRIRDVVFRLAAPAVRPAGRIYTGDNPVEGMVIHYRLREKTLAATLEVVSDSGVIVARPKLATSAGLHRVVWDGKRRDAEGNLVTVPPGEYRVRLRVGETVREEKVKVRPVPGRPVRP